MGGVVTTRSSDCRVDWLMVDHSTDNKAALTVSAKVVLGHLRVLVGPSYAKCYISVIRTHMLLVKAPFKNLLC